MSVDNPTAPATATPHAGVAALSSNGRGTLPPAAGVEPTPQTKKQQLHQEGARVPAMCHVLSSTGQLQLGGGVCLAIPPWYDDLAKTGLVPR
jgi:hypothetical protein